MPVEWMVLLFMGGFGLIAVIRGAISLLAPDLSWEITQWRNARRGLASSRTEDWENQDRWSGGFTLLLGFGLIAAAVWCVMGARA